MVLKGEFFGNYIKKVNILNEIFLSKELSDRNLFKNLKRLSLLNDSLPSELKQILVDLAKQSKKGKNWTKLKTTDCFPTNEYELTRRLLHLPDGRFMSFKLVVKASKNSCLDLYKIGLRWV